MEGTNDLRRKYHQPETLDRSRTPERQNLIQVAETLRTQAGLSKQALPTRLEVPVVLQGISPEKTSIQSFEQYLNYGR